MPRSQTLWSRSLVSILCGIGVQACSGASPLEPSTPAPLNPVVTTRRVIPSTTAPGIVPTIGDHFIAIGPAAGRRGRLLMFYPGTNGRPDQYSAFITRAGALGYHAIGLAYHNTESINIDVCLGRPPSCHEAVRLEILTGTESGYTPPGVDVNNSAFNRLAQLLRYLDLNYRDEGWGTYLDATGEPKWDLIAVGGHSQGGGHAAMTAKIRRVDRVLLFDATEPAAWTLSTFLTPANRFLGFAHTLEPQFLPITQSWQNLRLPGALTLVDEAAPPFGGAHQLSTRVDSCRGDPASSGFHHRCPVVDDAFPFANDGRTPLFQSVWDYMLTQALP